MKEDNSYTEYFSDPDRVKNYAMEPPKFVPGFFDMHRMTCVLLSEHTAPKAHILVHGAGGGLELESFATFNHQWTFLGVDPALPMLEAAQRRLSHLNDRIALHHGLIADSPDIKFDAATSLLTLHVLNAQERQNTVSEIVHRLKPGAPFIAVHCSFPQDERDVWLNRHQAYTTASGIDSKTAEMGRLTLENTLHVLSPEQDEAILKAAGLKNVYPFYAAFTWRGWVGYA